jgi:hypothetical protein
MCIHCLGHFFPLLPLPPPAPCSPTPLAGRTCSALFSNFVEEKASNNKKDKAFLLVEIRIATQRDFTHKCVTTRIDSSLPDLFTSSWSPSHIDLCHFKVSVLAPLQWRHQTLSSFGSPTYPHTSHIRSPLSVWPNSNNIAAFALDLKSAYEGEHKTFGLLSLANLVQNDVLQFHSFTWWW